MKITFLSSFLFILFREILSQNPLNSIFKCDDSSKTSRLKIGDEVTLCLHIFERTKRIAYRINVDKYSVLTIVGEYYYADKDTTNTNHSIIAQIGNNMTIYNSQYYLRNKFYVPLFNIIIKVNSGNITDIIWQNDCYTCLNTDACVTNNISALYGNTSVIKTEKNCISPLNQCNINNKTQAFSCDPKFYITWFGTDADGKPMSSSNLSLEKFRQYSIGSLYSSAVGVFNNTVNQVTGLYDTVKNQVNGLINSTTSLLF